MLKEEFLKKLADKLHDLSETDRNEYLDDFSELIDDRMESGGAEETVIEELGDITEIAEHILQSIPVKIDSAVIYTEEHSIIDCTNRFKMDDGKYNFTIKIPAGVKLKDVLIEITKDYHGTSLFCTNLSYFDASPDWGSSVRPNYNYNGGNYSYNGSDYYEMITEKLADGGMGIRLYLKYNDKYYMATDTSIKSIVKGNGYWLGA